MCRSKLFYLVALAMGIAAVVLTLAEVGYDADPLLAVGLLFLALGCMDNECCKPVAKRRR